MTLTEKRLGAGRYNNTTVNTVYTVPASTTAIIRSIRLCNTSTATATFRLFLVPTGGTADQTTAIYYDVTLGANETLGDDAFHVLVTAGTVQFSNGTANAITITISGAEIS